MSIFDDIGKGFEEAGKTIGGLVTGDTYFPDNSCREARSKELSGDISQISYRIVDDNNNIKTGLKDLNASIESVYRDIGIEPPAIAVPGNVNYHKTEYQISQLITPLVAVQTVKSALTDSAVVGELEAGEIEGEAAAEALGAAGLELGSGAVIMAGVVAVIGVIEGAEKRDKLQTYIHKLYPLRQTLKVSEIIDMKLANALIGLSTSVKILGKLGYTEAQLTEQIQKLIKNAEGALSIDVSSDARQQLASMDNSRGSWTNKDT
jgi:hypothetical protein